MSLLTICNNAVADTSFAQVSQVFGNPSQTATALLACARRAVKDLVRHNNGNWTALNQEWEFTTNAITIVGDTTQGSPTIINIPTTAGLNPFIFMDLGGPFPGNTFIKSVDSVNQMTMSAPATATLVGTTLIEGQCGYQCPGDFGSFIDNTMWDRTRYWKMRGPLSPQQWQAYKSSAIGKSSIERRWRLKQLFVGVANTNFFFIDPTPSDIGSQLVLEYMSNSPIQAGGGTNPIPDWATDADTCKLDEYVVELGVKYRMMRRFGYDYSVELDEWERACDVYAANDGGMAILSLAPDADFTLIGPWNVPEGGFGN